MADKEKKDLEKDEAKKYPYPKSVLFIISTEFCERFSFYGMKTVLSLFFKQVLNFDQDLSTLLYHAFTALCYFTPIFGAILADSFVGKFRTIFYISIVYAIGQVVLTIGAIGNDEGDNEGIHGLPADAMAYIGLLLIALGTGGIKPCVASFGGEQFKLPEQSNYLKSFFSMFYASINAGSLISTILTPILRQNTECFGQDSCYPLAFGVPAALMVIAILFFLAGRIFNLYVMIQPKENIIVKTVQCIWHSFKQSRKSKDKKPSFLDHGLKKYGKDFIDDVKALGNVVYMFLPFPIFWALFDQQGSRWTFQATRMNGDTFGFVILPDMMQVSNPLLILAFIPIFDSGIYPILTKFKLLRTPLQRMVAGGILACLSFVISGVLELALEKSYPDLPKEGNMHLTVYNGFENCTLGNVVLFQKDGENKINQMTLDFNDAMTKYQEINDKPIGAWFVQEFKATCPDEDFEFEEQQITNATLPAKYDDDEYEDSAQHILISLDTLQQEGIIGASKYRERLDKSDTGLPIAKLFWNLNLESPDNVTISLVPEGKEKDAVEVDNVKDLLGDWHFVTLKNVGKYSVKIFQHGNEIFKKEIEEEFRLGANYQILIQYDDPLNKSPINELEVHKITSENEIHIFWLLPQFVVMTAGEIMFSITSLQFSFTQAPESMKAVMMAIRMLTNAFGNVIDVVIIALLKDVFDSQVYFFFLFAGIMFLDMVLFGWMATKYVYKDYTTKDRGADENEGNDAQKAGKANDALEDD